jgi:molecular chaperone IbpA
VDDLYRLTLILEQHQAVVVTIGGDVLYKGIAERTFERSFQLADHVVVKGARLENGLLHVDLEREIPEAMKPRAIPIASSGKVLQVKPTKVAA